MNQPDDPWRDDDRRKILYVHSSSHSTLVTWLLGIAATLVTGSIIACAALLWSMNANMTLIVYRLNRVETAVEKVRN